MWSDCMEIFYVFVRHYLKDMAADTELQDIPLVATRMALH